MILRAAIICLLFLAHSSLCTFPSKGKGKGGFCKNELFPFLKLCSADLQGGPEKKVNPDEFIDNFEPRIAKLTKGNYVVVWSYVDPEDDLSHIAFKIFNEDNKPIFFSEMPADQDGDNFFPDVVGLANGDFVITWISFLVDGERIIARRFRWNGQPVDDQFIVDENPGDTVGGPAIDAFKDKTQRSYVIVWSVDEGDTNPLYSQVFDDNDLPLDDPFQISPDVINSGFKVYDVSVLTTGEYVVAYKAPPGDGRFRICSGVMMTSCEAEQTFFEDFIDLYVQTAPLPKGKFVIAFGSTEAADAKIFVQRFDSNGVPLEDAVPVSNLAGDQFVHSIESFCDGSFIVTFEVEDFGPNEEDVAFGRLFNQFGQPACGGEFQISELGGDNEESSVETFDGKFVITYEVDEPEDNIYLKSYCVSNDGCSKYEACTNLARCVPKNQCKALAFDQNPLQYFQNDF